MVITRHSCCDTMTRDSATYQPSTSPSLTNQVSFLFDMTVFCRLRRLYAHTWGLRRPVTRSHVLTIHKPLQWLNSKKYEVTGKCTVMQLRSSTAIKIETYYVNFLVILLSWVVSCLPQYIFLMGIYQILFIIYLNLSR